MGCKSLCELPRIKFAKLLADEQKFELCQKNLHLASQTRSSTLFYPHRRDWVYVMGVVYAKLVLSVRLLVWRPSAFYSDSSKFTKRRFEKTRLMDT